MAENIVAGLFGLTPQMYGEQQRRSALREGIDLAKLTRGEAGAAMTYAGARGLGGAIAGALGVEDPQMKKMSQRNQLLQQLDVNDPESFVAVAKQAAGLGQQVSQAGANVGQLGLRGAEQSVALATGKAATTNPYATLLGGVGSSDALGQVVGGMFSGVPATTAMSAPATTFGTGNYYGRQDLGLFL